jgi:hypothetical protein
MHDVQDAGCNAIVECFMIATPEKLLAVTLVCGGHSHLVPLRRATQFSSARLTQSHAALESHRTELQTLTR